MGGSDAPRETGILSMLRVLVTIGLSVGIAGEAIAGTPMLRAVLGREESVSIKSGETLHDVAYQQRLGFEAVARVNPGVDPWIPAPGTNVTLPTRYILPDTDEEGLVINLPEMRLFDYTVRIGPQVFALAIGDEADRSLLGEYVVGKKRENPAWHVPKAIRAEKPDLPEIVPPGPDNPLGSRWISIGNTSYGIHGTNVQWSIGREATHGCLRLYEDEIQRLYGRVREGTRIQIVYQPIKWGADREHIYLEVHPDLYGLRPSGLLTSALDAARALGVLDRVDAELVRRAVEEARGIPVAVGAAGPPTSSPTY
jgi:L,D-transpeptidase ErfK/SrfK